MHRLEHKSGRQSPESGSGLRAVSERMAESGRMKRTAPSAPFAGAGSDEASVDELQARLDALFRPVDSSCIHNLSSADGKKQLASQMWIGGFDEQIARLRADNFMLVSVLQAQISNTYRPPVSQREEYDFRKARQVDGALLNLVRAQSQFRMPLITTGLSVLAECSHQTEEYHDALSQYFKGAATSENFVKDFLPLAMAERPPPIDMIPGVMAAVFDNLQMKTDYSSYMSGGVAGIELKMTNWLDTPLPLHISPNFNAKRIFQRGMFWTDVSFSAFCRLFFDSHPDIQSNKVQRWQNFFKAAANGRLFERVGARDRWKLYKTYHPPIFGKLQSSYENVVDEVREMCDTYIACTLRY